MFLQRVNAPGRESNEAHVSTESPPPRADPWFPRPDAHQERSHRAQAAPRQGPQAPDRLVVLTTGASAAWRRPRALMMSTRLDRSVRLRVRAEFSLVQDQGRRVATRYLTLLAMPNSLNRDRLGIIASRRLGGAI